MSNAVHNARITLLANLLNTMAGSSFTVGVAAPIAAAFFYNPAGLRPFAVAIGAAVWIVIALALHIVAQWVLAEAPRMTDLQLFAFVILPVCVGLLGLLMGWAARFIP